MSQPTAAARAARTAPAYRPGPRPARRPLQVVSAAPARGSGGFVALCALLLFAGLIGVLVLNTTMAKGSFELDRLQSRSAALSDTQESLTHDVDAVSVPAELARRALALGMVPSRSAAFLRLSDGKILGKPVPATRKGDFSIATGPSVPSPNHPTKPVPAKGATTKVTTTAPKTSKASTKKKAATKGTTKPATRPTTPPTRN